MKVLPPSKARASFYAVIKSANRDADPILVAGADDEKSAYIVGKQEFEAMQETMALLMNGQIEAALSREEDDDLDLDDLDGIDDDD
ncbi:MAG: type II toxin-antitoxin system Phd/YefM family antitoxin [Lactobacillus sp.]|jgi:PHD/YefM family antitoxin component YafN of YafNO toxin-antitoxin module|nr:type II toxin-antitoxin system Phd/YefM family antitoxin [Lactobacillus sp.]MCI2032639.1 type II toxin-antitoxin system Phd/YefM family antitoxin [Lactobacillus sp.]